MQNAELKQKYRSFLSGYDDFRESCQVNHSDIKTAMNSCFRDVVDNTYRDNNSSVEDTQLSHACDMEVRKMQHTLELLQDGGVGYLTERKPTGWVRIMRENWNSLGVFTHNWKLDRLKYLIKHLHVDLLAGCELQCNWSFQDPGS